jgi:hypothetical protein
MCAAHRDVETGGLHGHTWEVWASFLFDGTSSLTRQAELQSLISEFDHTELPRELAWAEPFAAHVGARLPSCIKVEVDRPSERLCAIWPA